MIIKNNRLSTSILGTAFLVIIVAVLVIRVMRERTVDQKRAVSAVIPGTNTAAATKTPLLALDHARQLIRALRASAMKTSDVQALCVGNGALLEQLRLLGAEAIPAYLSEIADKTSPASLRILLIEVVAHLVGRHDARGGQVLMAIITDTTDDKGVRMQALQWIPVTGDQTAGAKLLEMLPQQTDAGLEFGITRALRGFNVPGSVGILKDELADEKGYLIRIAAAHAVAAQGGQEALTLLQNAVASKLVAGIDESHAEENAVAVHAVLALAEIPDASSVIVLSSILTNPANSISVRNSAASAIGAIGGTAATEVLRNALQTESNESVLAYVARGLALCGDTVDANACLAKAAKVSDSYSKSELERASSTLQAKIKQ